MIREDTWVVQEADTTAFSAATRGMDLPRVLSTPRMIGWMETTCYKLAADHLVPGQTTVGSAVNIRHLAATPQGAEVRTRGELLEINGRRLRYRVEAWDGLEKIGEGEHERFIIDCTRFDKRLEEKRAALVK
ncbi:MAG: thioesterase family protein [Anaerolineaceae bacterium]|nr:thioesterase family protein [Anaerolineaceae bacterium]